MAGRRPATLASGFAAESIRCRAARGGRPATKVSELAEALQAAAADSREVRCNIGRALAVKNPDANKGAVLEFIREAAEAGGCKREYKLCVAALTGRGDRQNRLDQFLDLLRPE